MRLCIPFKIAGDRQRYLWRNFLLQYFRIYQQNALLKLCLIYWEFERIRTASYIRILWDKVFRFNRIKVPYPLFLLHYLSGSLCTTSQDFYRVSCVSPAILLLRPLLPVFSS